MELVQWRYYGGGGGGIHPPNYPAGAMLCLHNLHSTASKPNIDQEKAIRTVLKIERSPPIRPNVFESASL